MSALDYYLGRYNECREETLGFRGCPVPGAVVKARRRKAKVRPARRRFMMVIGLAFRGGHLGTFIYRPDEFSPGEWENAKPGDIIDSDGDKFMRVK